MVSQLLIYGDFYDFEQVLLTEMSLEGNATYFLKIITLD